MVCLYGGSDEGFCFESGRKVGIPKLQDLQAIFSQQLTFFILGSAALGSAGFDGFRWPCGPNHRIEISSGP